MASGNRFWRAASSASASRSRAALSSANLACFFLNASEVPLGARFRTFCSGALLATVGVVEAEAVALVGVAPSGSLFLRGFLRTMGVVLAPSDLLDFSPPTSTSIWPFWAYEAALVWPCDVGVAVWRVGELGEGGDERPGEVESPRLAISAAADIL